MARALDRGCGHGRNPRPRSSGHVLLLKPPYAEGLRTQVPAEDALWPGSQPARETFTEFSLVTTRFV